MIRRDSKSSLSEQCALTPHELNTARGLFKVLDKFDYGFIEAEDLVLYLSECGNRLTKFQLNEMLDECGCSATGVIHFGQFAHILTVHKKKIEARRKESTLDAFLSVGGSLAEDASIDTNELIRIVKNEFQMTIDLESMIKEIDVDRSGKIDFEEFCALFNG